MTATLIDGKIISAQVRERIKNTVADVRAKSPHARAPGLAVILVGDNPASKTYVANKGKAARECGFETFDAVLPHNATYEQVASAIESFNLNPAVDGILLQLPLPKELDCSDRLISLIDPQKDADGLHPVNQGLLMQGRAELKPCTPAGCIELLEQSGVSLAGKHAVVIGRSILVGKPAALLLLEKHATVTIAHSKTKDLAAVVKSADIVVAAVGIPEFVKGDWIREGAVVIDVGINRMPDGKLKGDVDFDAASRVASQITPVPGGVGPMTIAMLLQNTLTAYLKKIG
jgi:methylenetetrahydrofolate dehydrogenase (NADP+)/methenyltetrahydrofolate cyclohydrolase